MVTIADGEKEDAAVGIDSVLLPEGFRIRESLDGGCHMVLHLRALHGEAGQMPAAQHEIEVIDGFHVAGHPDERFDDGVVGVVDEHEDVRQFKRGAFTDAHARRQPVEDGPFGGADEGLGTFVVIIVFQIES